MARPPRTDAESWIDAGYARFRVEGLAGVRIEAVARDLGATKGSFYWHFADRRALVDAVMARWEHEETDRYIEESRAEADAQRRVEKLFAAVGSRRPPGEDRLYTAAVAEGVSDVVERVTRRRVAYVADALEEAGIPRATAEARALIAVSATLGLEQLAQGGAASVIARDSVGATMIAFMFA